MNITVRGNGPDLVMLHGWSMHSGVWHDFADTLAEHFTLHLVDLPGHGQSGWQDGDFELTHLLPQLASLLPEKAAYIGWSLGGLVALAFHQRYPDRMTALCLMASTPCFVQREGWTTAMAATVFASFAENLSIDQKATLQQFLLLQARGSQHSRQTIKALAAEMDAVGQADDNALAAGLDLLMTMDMRQAMTDLVCPVLLLLGERDTLIPAEMAEAAQGLNPEIVISVIEGAGHAPFISHEKASFEAVLDFLT